MLFLFTLPALGWSSSENLDELHARKSRQDSAAWGKEYLEDSSILVWQPETMCYNDVKNGVEVWRISTTNGTKNSLPDISWSHWSADGKRFSFGSHRDTSACSSNYETNPNQSYQGTVMMMRADGSYLRPADNAPFEVYVHSRYLHWSTVEPDIYYGFGRNFAWEGLEKDDLYKVYVDDTSISREKYLDFNTGSETSFKKSMSSDGTTIVAFSNGKNYPAAIYPEGDKGLIDLNGWDRDPVLDDFWGMTPSADYGYHDNFLRGQGSDIWFYFLPEGFSSWWRMKLSGGRPDGGPQHSEDHTHPYAWGEIEPVNTSFAAGDTCDPDYRDPWCCDGNEDTDCSGYWSHPGFDRWGTKVSFTNSQRARGAGVYDIKNHVYDAYKIDRPHYDWHQDWSAWSDYFVSSSSGNHDISDFLYTSKYDGTVNKQLCSAHTRESGSTAYNSLARATQSPDGTKVVFHSDFLYDDSNEWDLFYAIAYYPHPPEITSCNASEGTVTIRFDWRLNSPNPRGYTDRGWPNEETDPPPPPRETKEFRLWRSPDGVAWSPIATVSGSAFDRYDFSTGTWTGNNYWELTDTPGDGIWYYAVTAVEWSGLESQTLSNVYEITVNSGSITGSEITSYPADPKGDSGFNTNAPAAPTNVTFSHKLAPADKNGQYTITWDEPSKADLIRYYNIYAEDSTNPIISQENRIASVPATTDNDGDGSYEYIDVFGNPDGSTQYAITAVDYQGNESISFNEVTLTPPPNLRINEKQ